MKKHRSQTGGFTLIEIVITLTLMGILLGLIGLDTKRFTDQGRETRQILLSHLHYVKSMSMATQQTVGLEIDTEAKQYRGIRYDPNSSLPDPFQANPLVVQLEIKGIATNLPGNKIFYNSFGQPIDASGEQLSGQHMIVLQLEDKKQTLFIEPETGYIHP